MKAKPTTLHHLLFRAFAAAMLKQLVLASVIAEYEAREKAARIPPWLLG